MATGLERPSKWIPMANKVDLACLGKMGEECGELVSILSRCIIQGIDENDPDTGISNRESLSKEIADVNAMLWLAIDHFGLDAVGINIRATRKYNMKREWWKMLEEDDGHQEQPRTL